MAEIDGNRAGAINWGGSKGFNIDFEKIFNDPLFGFGAGLLGAQTSKTPLLTAMQSMQAMQKNKREAEDAKMRRQLQEQQSKLYGQQVATAQRNQEMQQRALEGVSKFLQSQGLNFPGMGGQPPTGDGQPGMPPGTPPFEEGMIPQQMQPGAEPPQQQMAPPQAPMQAPQPQMQPPGGMSATPTPQQPPSKAQILFKGRIIPAESGGSHWESPGVPKTSKKGAIGIAQVMPTTGPEAAKLAGLPWDPQAFRMNPEYNAALGEAYFTKQMEDFKEPAKAAAAYNAGPEATRRAIDIAEKAKRPDIWMSLLPKETQEYIQKTTGQTGIPKEGTPPPPTTILGTKSKAMPMIAAGAMLEMAGVKGGQGLIDLGKAMEPNNVPAGSYQQDPSTGKLTYVPDPEAQRKAVVEDKRLGLEERRVTADEKRTAADEKRALATAGKTEQEAKVELGKASQAISNVNANMDRLKENAQKLLDHPGLKMITGVTGGLINPRLLGEDARNAAAILEVLKAQAFVNGTTALRAASATGAGVGNQSDKEGDKLQASQARLSQAQSLPEFKEALKELIQLTDGTKERMTAAYETSFPGQKLQAPKTIKRTGTLNGRKVIQYSDGTTEYAN